MRSELVWGAAAGAAGTTVLNAVTYLDMVLRGRPASTTPEQTVEAISDAIGVPVPGEGDARDARVSGLGALSGIAAGVGSGVLYGALRAAGAGTGRGTGTAAATALALLAGNGPMTALKVTDPRRWSSADWLADVVPHLAYGVVTAAVFGGLEGRWNRPARRR